MFFDDVSFFANGDIKNNNYKFNDYKLVDCKTGYIRGNMFADEYIPFKNYQVRQIMPKTEEEQLLLKLNEAEFALNDLSLYLDLHPEDTIMFNKFMEEVNNYKRYLDLYEKNYRPMCLTDEYMKSYDYYKNPWPWDNDGGVKYV